MTNDWGAPRTREHTFETGRTATLRIALPVTKLIRDGVWDDELAAAFDMALAGTLEDERLAMRLGDALVIGMFVDPRIVPDPTAGESVPDGAAPISFLDEVEMDETIRAAFGGPASDASFPGDADGVAGVGDGVDVAPVAVDAGGVGAGERGGVRAGREGGSRGGGAA